MARRVFYLMGYSPQTGAATVIVGALGIEGPAGNGSWESHVSWVPMLYEKAEGWQTSVADAGEAGGLTGRLVDEWVADANGITREIAEVAAPAAATLTLAVAFLPEPAVQASCSEITGKRCSLLCASGRS